MLFLDLVRFIYKCFTFKPEVVVLNPSLRKGAIQRDALYLRVSKLFNIPTIAFFHGWDEHQVQQISKKPAPFVEKFKRADAFLVLASAFKKQLMQWGIDKPIYLTTTKIDDSLIQDFDINNKVYGNNLLFLARITKEKGIFTTLKVFKKVKEKFPQAQLIVAGDGRALDDAKKNVNNNSISGVNFPGFISGEKLIKVFRNSDLYLFPTEHGEGMPTSLLEAMAFGLPIISRPVGGMVDFFENDKMGYLLESTKAEDYVEKVIAMLENEDKLKKIGRYNHEFACDNFLASKVAEKLERIFKGVE
jgi:glycosyltransferase involved in cell wall biosynthesis